MRMINGAGQEIYYNVVQKNGHTRYIIKAISGQDIPGRDRQKLKSRTFKREPQVESWLKRHGYSTN